MIRRSWAPLCLVLALLLAGCGGDNALWARYRAERDMWRARRAVERVALRPEMASPADVARARAALESIVRRYPIATWSKRAAAGPGMARDVVLLSGRAELALGRIDEMQAALPKALERYDRMAGYETASPELAVEALEARALALEHAGRAPEALQAWIRVVQIAPLVEPESGRPLEVALEAPLRAAELLANLGREGSADSLLDQSSARLRAVLGDPQLTPVTRARLCYALVDQRQARGDLDGALAAVRIALVAGLPPEEARRAVLVLGQQSMAAGRADSARTYARWAAHGFGSKPARDALLLEARAWQVTGPPDSALAAWASLLDAYPRAQDEAAEARFQRGLIYEAMDRWEQARTELRTLAASQPTHSRAFEAQVLIVRHHASRGEMDLARVEGRRAIEIMNQMIDTQHDDRVQQLARRARSDISLAVGDTLTAALELVDLWRQYPGGSEGARAGLDAARLLDHPLRQPARADSLYRELAASADDPGVRDHARETLARRTRAVK